MGRLFSKIAFMASAAMVVCPNLALGQFFNPFNRVGVVGGVSIDSDGVVRQASLAERSESLRQLRQQLQGASRELAAGSELRMISLKKVQAAIAEAKATGRDLTEEFVFLGGLTRIDYVLVYPEQQDIVIAGPGENWIVSEDGSIVGQKSGRPVFYLDDLVCALHSVHRNSTDAVSCSIEPTEEGSKRLNALLAQVKLGPGSDPRAMEQQMCEAFGPQQIRLTGVPADSHLARVMLAADYQMKRYGMNLAEPPVQGLPSYIELVRNRNATPQSRWWMACSYDKLEHSQDMLAWKLSGKRIEALTEQEVIDAQGGRKTTGKQDAMAKKWADLFTAKMDEIAIKDRVFGELRNCMDLCVLAALIDARSLEDLANCDLSLLRGRAEKLPISSLGTPKSLPAQCSFLRSAGGWIVTTSGGVTIDPWSVVKETRVSQNLDAIRKDAMEPGEQRWVW
jgi:hypothetical protein